MLLITVTLSHYGFSLHSDQVPDLSEHIFLRQLILPRISRGS